VGRGDASPARGSEPRRLHRWMEISASGGWVCACVTCMVWAACGHIRGPGPRCRHGRGGACVAGGAWCGHAHHGRGGGRHDRSGREAALPTHDHPGLIRLVGAAGRAWWPRRRCSRRGSPRRWVACTPRGIPTHGSCWGDRTIPACIGRSASRCQRLTVLVKRALRCRPPAHCSPYGCLVGGLTQQLALGSGSVGPTMRLGAPIPWLLVWFGTVRQRPTLPLQLRGGSTGPHGRGGEQQAWS
jgi:hypothetical protein